MSNSPTITVALAPAAICAAAALVGTLALGAVIGAAGRHLAAAPVAEELAVCREKVSIYQNNTGMALQLQPLLPGATPDPYGYHQFTWASLARQQVPSQSLKPQHAKDK